MKNTKLNHPQSSNLKSSKLASLKLGEPARLGLVAVVIVLLAGGCSLRQTYPQTQIRGYINGQPFSVQAPKDSSLVGFDATSATNGSIHVHIDSLQSSINATNLANAANGQAAIITATAQAINQGIQTATAAAAKAMVP